MLDAHYSVALGAEHRTRHHRIHMCRWSNRIVPSQRVLTALKQDAEHMWNTRLKLRSVAIIPLQCDSHRVSASYVET